MNSGWKKVNNNNRNDFNNMMRQSIPLENLNEFMSHNTRGKRAISRNLNKINNSNESNITAVAGNWIAAIGTIISAIGSTPSTIFSEQTLKDFSLIGNILEAGGSAIVSETEEALLDIVGAQIAAIGNLVVVAGILSDNEQSGQLLEKQGDLLQVLGVGITINTQGGLTLIESIANTGNIIQVIGNTMQVLADTNTKEGVIVNAVGAWIQAVGSVITALATQ